MDLLQTTLSTISDLDYKSAAEAQKRLDILIKPQGSLGKMEEIVTQLAGIQCTARPELGKKVVIIMAADHGVAEEGISAFPPEASTLMMRNFLLQGAAVNILAKYTGAKLLLVDVGLSGEVIVHPDLYLRRIRPGTGNICREPAMTKLEAIAAIETGIDLVNQEVDAGITMVATGELGIGNTTTSTAILACLTGQTISSITGRGTGLDDRKLNKKRQVIKQALAVNQPNMDDPLDILTKLGGLEIAALMGVILGSAACRVPVVLDGLVAGAAALLASRMNEKCRLYLIAAHLSEEPGHRIMLEELELKPLLDFGLRIGEGTGAVLAFPMIEAAVKIFNEMATFDEVGIKLFKHGR